MYVKICGLRLVEHAEVAVAAGADAIGVVMNRTSSRRAEPDAARRIVDAVGDRVDTVLVVNDMPAIAAAEIAVKLGMDVLQLHGPAYGAEDFAAALAILPRVWRATSLAEDPPLTVGAFGEEVLLLDAPRPGSGELWDLSALADCAPQGHWLLAGGLSPETVGAALQQVAPWGVDVSSGVESAPGEKDPERIRAFIAAARASQPA